MGGAGDRCYLSRAPRVEDQDGGAELNQEGKGSSQPLGLGRRRLGTACRLCLPPCSRMRTRKELQLFEEGTARGAQPAATPRACYLSSPPALPCPECPSLGTRDEGTLSLQ